MPGPDRTPERVPSLPGAAPAARPCGGCGWPNDPSAPSCDFCRAPLQRAAPKGPPRPRPATCPLCLSTTLRAPGAPLCPECGHDARQAPSAADRAKWAARNAAGSIRIPGWGWAILLLVVPALVSFSVFFRAQQKATTADHVRQLKKIVEIAGIESGGFPAELSGLERRFGPVPQHLLVDGWGNPIVYAARKPLPSPGDDGSTLYGECEIRSAGPNGTPGDEDDVVWTGTPAP
jgi:hypothetical protein